MPWISKRELEALRKTIEHYEQLIKDLRGDKHATETALRNRINDLEQELEWFKVSYERLMSQAHDAISLLHKVGPWNLGGKDLYELPSPEADDDVTVTDDGKGGKIIGTGPHAVEITREEIDALLGDLNEQEDDTDEQAE